MDPAIYKNIYITIQIPGPLAGVWIKKMVEGRKYFGYYIGAGTSVFGSIVQGAGPSVLKKMHSSGRETVSIGINT